MTTSSATDWIIALEEAQRSFVERLFTGIALMFSFGSLSFNQRPCAVR